MIVSFALFKLILLLFYTNQSKFLLMTSSYLFWIDQKQLSYIQKAFNKRNMIIMKKIANVSKFNLKNKFKIHKLRSIFLLFGIGNILICYIGSFLIFFLLLYFAILLCKVFYVWFALSSFPGFHSKPIYCED